MEPTKICRVCQIEKPLSCFSKNSGNTHRNDCKQCFNEAKRNRSVPTVEANCFRCGKAFGCVRSKVKEGAKNFCSHECSSKRNVPVDALFEGKTCKTCGVFKPLAEYIRKKGVCKLCKNKAAHDDRVTNPEKWSAYGKKHNALHAETRRAYSKQYKKKVGAQYGGYHKKPGVYERVLEWHRNNRVRSNQFSRNWYAKPESKQIHLDKCHRRRARLRNAPEIEKVDRQAIIERDDCTCYLCQKNLAFGPSRDIHLDHVVPLSKGGSHTAANLRVACSSCNLRKHDKTLVKYLSHHGLPDGIN